MALTCNALKTSPPPMIDLQAKHRLPSLAATPRAGGVRHLKPTFVPPLATADQTNKRSQLAPADQGHSLHQPAGLSNHSSNAASYTSMRADSLSFWGNHQGLHLHRNTDEDLIRSAAQAEAENDDCLLSAELQLLRNAAADRAQMHAILAQQRDNWNKLFQRTLTATSMTACVLSGVAGAVAAGQGSTISLSLPALLLNAGGAAMMAIISQFQPSQLAEEQRTAARLFRKLVSDVDYALSVPAHLLQHTPLFLRECKRRMQALDKAFPMPLTPGGLEKFPAKVLPPLLIEPLITSDSTIDASVDPDLLHPPIGKSPNGWDKQLMDDLQHVASLLRSTDIPKYTAWAENLVKVNKCLAIVAPLGVASAAILNALMITTTLPLQALGMWAATCSVLAVFASSFSNDMQLGMVFELYRNSAGYYEDIQTSIKENLDTPVQYRENGTLFRQRIAYQLGRWPDCNGTTAGSSGGNTLERRTASTLVPAEAKEAGTLF